MFSFASYYKDIPILTYHKVSNDSEFGITTVSTKCFKAQMEYLSNEGFSTVLPREYETFDHTSYSKPIIISFDDGYESVYENAFPILNEFGFKAIVFIISDYIGKLNTWDANLGKKYFRHLDEAQIKKLIESNWEIGCHTCKHETLLKKQNLEVSVSNSIQKLEQMFNIKIDSFSYPFGTHTKRSINYIRNNNLYGFKATPQKSTKEHIGRCSVYSHDSIKNIKNKIKLSFKELIKLKLINLGAKLTEIGQLLNWIRR